MYWFDCSLASIERRASFNRCLFSHNSFFLSFFQSIPHALTTPTKRAKNVKTRHFLEPLPRRQQKKFLPQDPSGLMTRHPLPTILFSLLGLPLPTSLACSIPASSSAGRIFFFRDLIGRKKWREVRVLAAFWPLKSNSPMERGRL